MDKNPFTGLSSRQLPRSRKIIQLEIRIEKLGMESLVAEYLESVYNVSTIDELLENKEIYSMLQALEQLIDGVER